MATSSEHAIFCTLKPSLDLRQDYFAVFGLEPAFEIDVDALAGIYRQLQKSVHPDRFVRECDRSQRLAQQQAALVNAAYNTLRLPLLRAQYLLELAGKQRIAETTLQDSGYLMEQMALRERLEDSAKNIDALDELLVDVKQSLEKHQNTFASAWQDKDWKLARLCVDKMQFASKLMHEINDRQARLLDDA